MAESSVVPYYHTRERVRHRKTPRLPKHNFAADRGRWLTELARAGPGRTALPGFRTSTDGLGLWKY